MLLRWAAAGASAALEEYGAKLGKVVPGHAANHHQGRGVLAKVLLLGQKGRVQLRSGLATLHHAAWARNVVPVTVSVSL